MTIRRFKLLKILVVSMPMTSCYFQVDRQREELVVTELVSALSIDLGSGDVEVVGADVAETSVTARVEGERNHMEYMMINGVLQLRVACGSAKGCEANVLVQVPGRTSVDIETGSGDVTLRNLAGDGRFETGSGDVLGIGLRSQVTSVESGSGEVHLDFDVSPANVSVTTGSGDTAVIVPTGTYRVALQTGSGDESITDVEVADVAPSRIDIETGSGDVRVQGKLIPR